jgi:hypothetical protein
MTRRAAIRQRYSPALLALVWVGLLLLLGVWGTISTLASPDAFGLNGAVVLLLWVVLLVVWVVGLGAFMLGQGLVRAWLR